ncbi:hypothetical protein KFE25_010709 [Diacronema lutheri]|uniref:Homeobox domain-containing protein n=1 Tax=Diacronema lutheri TaxID=2081491 RepID=A0A8J6CAZ2_DIALT|nr:hypothetical protein KFE25_010709 [Diacronema lutheri]
MAECDGGGREGGTAEGAHEGDRAPSSAGAEASASVTSAPDDDGAPDVDEDHVGATGDTPAAATRRKGRRTFDPNVLALLKEIFAANPSPSAQMQAMIAESLGMTLRSVQIWFQNRRRRLKRKAPDGLADGMAGEGSSPRAFHAELGAHGDEYGAHFGGAAPPPSAPRVDAYPAPRRTSSCIPAQLAACLAAEVAANRMMLANAPFNSRSHMRPAQPQPWPAGAQPQPPSPQLTLRHQQPQPQPQPQPPQPQPLGYGPSCFYPQQQQPPSPHGAAPMHTMASAAPVPQSVDGRPVLAAEPGNAYQAHVRARACADGGCCAPYGIGTSSCCGYVDTPYYPGAHPSFARQLPQQPLKYYPVDAHSYGAYAHAAHFSAAMAPQPPMPHGYPTACAPMLPPCAWDAHGPTCAEPSPCCYAPPCARYAPPYGAQPPPLAAQQAAAGAPAGFAPCFAQPPGDELPLPP